METSISNTGYESAASPRIIRTQADIEAFERTPWQDKVPAQNTYDLLCRACDRHAHKTALRFVMTGDPETPEFTVDYTTLKSRVTQAANAFYRAGIGPGDKVALLLPNLPETHYAMLGAQAAGIASPINPMLGTDYVAAIVNSTGARALVACAPLTDSALWDKAVEVVNQCPSINVLFVVEPARYLPAADRARLQEAFGSASRPRRPDVDIVYFDAALQAEPSDALVSGRRILGTSISAYFHTGGTTGLPKVAMHAHLNEAFVASMLESMIPSPNTILCGLPLFHVNGAMVTGLAAFHAGWEVVMLTPAGYRGPGVMPNFWKLVERFRATSFSGVPTIYATLADLPMDGADISSLRFAFCGAAPLPAEVARRFERAAGIPLYEGYGLTEGACVSALNPPAGERRPGTVGLRLPHQEIGVWKLDGQGQATGRCVAGETGVIGISGPNVFAGYLHEEDNRGIWLRPEWLNTGDLGHLDADGYLHLTGRAKELIIRGGHNIDPAMIEDALLQHPGVAMAAAVGQPDAHAGELPVAYITLKRGITHHADELMAAARKLVPERAAVPSRIDILEDMPLTSVGKVARAELRMRAAERAFRELLDREGVTASIRVAPDMRRGTVAFVSCAARDESRIQDLLARFPFSLDFSRPA